MMPTCTLSRKAIPSQPAFTHRMAHTQCRAGWTQHPSPTHILYLHKPTSITKPSLKAVFHHAPAPVIVRQPQGLHLRTCHATSPGSTNTNTSSSFTPANDITLRQGNAADLPIITSYVIKEWLNPVGLDPSRFVVATTRNTQGQEEILGFGQLKPRDPMSGVVSGTGKCWEVGTLVTQPQFRNRGVASSVIRTLLGRVTIGDVVWAMTTESKVEFYGRLGFRLLNKEEMATRMQGSMALEFTIGSVIAPAVTKGQQLVLLEARPGQQQ